MDHAHRVRGVQHTHHRSKHCQGFNRREPAVLSQFGVERAALDVFHHQVDRAVG